MLDRFRNRSHELENIDRGTYTPEEYEESLVELRRVNRVLGDASVLRRTLLREVARSKAKSFSVLDVGAGSGYLLRVIASWARKTGRRARLCGLEINKRSADAILEESEKWPEISSVQADGLRLPFPDDSFDFSISSLALHHFDDEDVVRILREMSRVVVRTVYVIDLHRHPIAYLCYTTIGRMILHNRLLREDGALSILRSFKPDELLALARRANMINATVKRRFPYRLVLKGSDEPLEDLFFDDKGLVDPSVDRAA